MTVKERIAAILALVRSGRDDEMREYTKLQPRLIQLLEMDAKGITHVPANFDWRKR